MLLSNVKLKPGEDNLVVEALTIELDLNVGTPEDGFMIEYYTDSTTSALTFTECDPNRGAAFRCAIAFHCPFIVLKNFLPKDLQLAKFIIGTSPEKSIHECH